MLQRVCRELMGMKNIVVINDEAHHCYREKPRCRRTKPTSRARTKDEAKKNNEAARLWISGIEIVKRKLGVRAVYDLSATPFFLRGSGYAEGTLFPWTVSDFSLMDAIECGIVKLPRVPVADNMPGGDMPMLPQPVGAHRQGACRRRGAARPASSIRSSLPTRAADRARRALRPLREDLRAVAAGGHRRAAGLHRRLQQHRDVEARLRMDLRLRARSEDGEEFRYVPGQLELFRNFDEHGNRLPGPSTLLIDSEQLESGDALDDDFRDDAGAEIEQFKREMVAALRRRGGARRSPTRTCCAR